MGLLCLSPQLAQNPSIQTEKGSVIAAKPKPEMKRDTLCCGVRVSHPLILSPACYASATWTVLPQFRIWFCLRVFAEWVVLAADFFPHPSPPLSPALSPPSAPPCLHPSAPPHTSLLQSVFLATSAALTESLGFIFFQHAPCPQVSLACLLLQAIHSPRERTVCLQLMVSPHE